MRKDGWTKLRKGMSAADLQIQCCHLGTISRCESDPGWVEFD